jgi:hypothetical protein
LRLRGGWSSAKPIYKLIFLKNIFLFIIML